MFPVAAGVLDCCFVWGCLESYKNFTVIIDAVACYLAHLDAVAKASVEGSHDCPSLLFHFLLLVEKLEIRVMDKENRDG